MPWWQQDSSSTTLPVSLNRCHYHTCHCSGHQHQSKEALEASGFFARKLVADRTKGKGWLSFLPLVWSKSRTVWIPISGSGKPFSGPVAVSRLTGTQPPAAVPTGNQ